MIQSKRKNYAAVLLLLLLSMTGVYGCGSVPPVEETEELNDPERWS